MTKSDWLKWKIQFLNSDYGSVREFFRQEVGKFEDSLFERGDYIRNTSCWREEKNTIFETKVCEVKEVLKKSYEIDVESLLETKKKVIDYIFEEMPKTNSVRDIRIMWEIIKTELGEPTTVREERNVNKQDDDNFNLFLKILHSSVKE